MIQLITFGIAIIAVGLLLLTGLLVKYLPASLGSGWSLVGAMLGLELFSILQASINRAWLLLAIIPTVIGICLLMSGLYTILGLSFWSSKITRKHETFTAMHAVGLAGFTIISIGVTWCLSTSPTWYFWLLGVISAWFAYFGCFFAATAISALLTRFRPAPTHLDTVIVLGAGLLNGNQIGKILTFRLQTTVTLAQRFPSAMIIVSGGQGPDESQTEASAMKAWLVLHHVDSDRIFSETQSTNTSENLRNSFQIINQKGLATNPTVVSNSFHVFRAQLLARRQQHQINVVHAHTPLSYLPNALIREFLAILIMYRRQHLLILSIITVAWLILGLMI